MNQADTIIHARFILTAETENSVLDHHSLVIQDGKIFDILPTPQAKKHYQAKTTHDLTSHALMPGIINCHTHLSMNYFRGLADDLELMAWLENHIWPAESRWVSEEFVYDASTLAIAEMIRGGTTCFNDMYFFLNATAKAAETAGIRAHIGMTVIDVPTAWAKTTEDYFQKGIAFCEAYQHHPLITPTLAPHSTYGIAIDSLVRVKKLADDFKLKVNIHLHEAPSEINSVMLAHHKRPIEILNDLDLLNHHLIAAHMTQVTAEDMELLEKTKPSIVNCPESNMKLASGACPVEALHQIGINVALGTDGSASNNDLDMFSEMRSAAFSGKVRANDSTATPAGRVLQMATINGAKALGIDQLTGTLSKGKAADMIAINLDTIETQPLYHPISQLVYATPRTQVTDVWVNGKQLLKNRQLTTLDETAIIAKAKEWAKKIGQNTSAAA